MLLPTIADIDTVSELSVREVAVVPVMWCGARPAGADLEASFFCGDAAGEEGDALDAPSDRGFAAAAGLPFKTPKEVFGCEALLCPPFTPLLRSPLVAAGA